MPRYAEADSDEARLPEGMERVGYDADSQTYTYRDQDGSAWEGEPGARFGTLRPSGSGYQPMTAAKLCLSLRQKEIPANSIQAHEMQMADKAAWRYMLPFFLLILVALFSLFRYLGLGTGAPASPFSCKEGFVRYLVKRGDSCWQIAHDRGIEVADLVRSNEGLNCELLKAGREICVPVGK